jgi:hypothetical protein
MTAEQATKPAIYSPAFAYAMACAAEPSAYSDEQLAHAMADLAEDPLETSGSNSEPLADFLQRVEKVLGNTALARCSDLLARARRRLGEAKKERLSAATAAPREVLEGQAKAVLAKLGVKAGEASALLGKISPKAWHSDDCGKAVAEALAVRAGRR